MYLHFLLNLFHIAVCKRIAWDSSDYPVLSIDFSNDVSSQPTFDKNETINIQKSTTLDTYLPIQDLSLFPSYFRGIAVVFNFDNIDNNNITYDLIESRPCQIKPAPETSTTTNILVTGKWDNALPINNYCVTTGLYLADQPQTGFSGSAWIKSNVNQSAWDGTIFDRQWNNFQIDVSNNRITCTVRDVTNGFTSIFVDVTNIDVQNQWIHIACSFNPHNENELSLYINGILSAQVQNVTLTQFLHGSDSIVGVGNRPDLSIASSQFTGVIDEIAFWYRALETDEIYQLYSKNNAFPEPVLTGIKSHTLVRSDTFNKFREFTSVTVDYMATDMDAVIIEISTDGGLNWCEIEHNVRFSDFLHNGDINSLFCLFPAVSIDFKITWIAQCWLSSFQMQFETINEWYDGYSTYDGMGTYIPFPMGINLAGVSYWSQSLNFIDSMKNTGGCCWPYIEQGVDENYYPLSINMTSNDFWITGRISMLANNEYPAGNYTLYMNGTGTIRIQSAVVNSVFEVPFENGNFIKMNDDGIKGLIIPMDGISNIILSILHSSQNDYINDIKLLPSHITISESKMNPLHPFILEFVDGFKVLRYMDWLHTNGQQISHWKHRSTKTFISQDATQVYRYNISNIEVGNTSELNFVGPFSLKITFTGKHDLVTGQTVTLVLSHVEFSFYATSNSNNVMVRNVTDYNLRCEYIDEYNVYVNLPVTWNIAYWESEYSIINVNIYQIGYIEQSINPGVAYEYIALLSNVKRINPWITIPMYATDSFVQSLAELMLLKLDNSLSIYVEYSNEIWNWIFDQTVSADRFAIQLGLTGGLHQYVVRRSLEIISIFKTVFGNQSDRIFGVLAAQQGATYSSRARYLENDRIDETIAGSSHLSSRNYALTMFDAISIAPYFGGNLNGDVTTHYNVDTITIDEILDLARLNLVSSIQYNIKEASETASQFNVKLIAYEGGQHFGGGGNCPNYQDGSIACENIDMLQNKFQNANRNWRMYNLYQNLFHIWSENNGEEFASFSSVGAFSKWGSWGIIEGIYDNKTNAPKYQAIHDVITRYYNSMTTNSPTKIPTYTPSHEPITTTVLNSLEPSVLPTINDSKADKISVYFLTLCIMFIVFVV
eukprot:316173_1